MCRKRLYSIFSILIYNPLLSPHFIDRWELNLDHIEERFLPRVLWRAWCLRENETLEHVTDQTWMNFKFGVLTSDTNPTQLTLTKSGKCFPYYWKAQGRNPRLRTQLDKGAQIMLLLFLSYMSSSGLVSLSADSCPMVKCRLPATPGPHPHTLVILVNIKELVSSANQYGLHRLSLHCLD